MKLKKTSAFFLRKEKYKMITIIVFLNILFRISANLISVDLKKCRLTPQGTEYLGKLAITKTNATCQYWNSITGKESEKLLDEAFPDGSKNQAQNYCRNPNNHSKGPWCYTTEEKLFVETCDVPLCNISECRISGTGMEYAGSIENSASGKKCMEWKNSDKIITKHEKAPITDVFFPGGSVDEAGNKCRNPDGCISGPWCYVKDNSSLFVKELCDIPFCDNIDNMIYSKVSVSGRYFFFSSISKSQSFNISFRLWNPADWFQGQVYLFLSAFDIASDREDIERWNSGVEIKFSHNGSGFISKEEVALAKIPLILSGANWTNLEITWRNSDNQSLLIQVYHKPKVTPIAIKKIFTPNTIFQEQSFRYFSLRGSSVLWKIPHLTCPIHTVTQMDAAHFWTIKKTALGKEIEIFIRAKGDAYIVLRTVPMNANCQIQINIGDKDKKIKILSYDNNIEHPQQLAQIFWHNGLNLWKWEFFKIILSQNKLQLFWKRKADINLLLETTYPNADRFLWVAFGSSEVSYWTIYCDPKEGDFFKSRMRITETGRQCIPWTDKSSLPEKYFNDDLFKPYGGRVACENFCRNLDFDSKGAYCIIKDPVTKSSFQLEYCHPRIYRLEDSDLVDAGNDYTGELNITRSKRKCRIRSEVADRVVNIKNFPNPTVKNARSYCRNPNKNVGSWYHNRDKRVLNDYCFKKDCEKPLECTALTSGYKEGTYIFILPKWRKDGLHFSVKAWSPDIYEGLKITFFSMDHSKQYELLLGDENNEKTKLFYKDDKTGILVIHKTLPHLFPTGKWKGYWLRPGFGKIELGYQGVRTSFFEWTSSEKRLSFQPIFINFGTIQNHWMGVNFHCRECLTTKTYSQEGYKIYPINLWRDESVTSSLNLNLRGTGCAFVTLMWTPEFEKNLDIQIMSNSTSIYIVQYVKNQAKILASFPVSSSIVAHQWSEYIISFTENSLTVCKDKVYLLEWASPFSLLFNWFTVTAEGGTIFWSANCPPSDIDGAPRDGNWGKWGPWSCSVTCGKGQGRIERKCNDPPPNVYGSECKGSSVYEGPCNDFPCGKISPDTNSLIRKYLSSQHKSLQVDAAERVVLPCNSGALSIIAAEVYDMNVTWTHNGFPYSRTKFHMDENYSLVIPRAQEKHNGIYLCIAFQDPDSIPSKVVLEVISLVVIKPKPTKKIRKGNSLTLKCNGLALSYVYADLSHRWELNGNVWKDYGLGTLQTFTVDKLENITDFHAGVWTCVIVQEDFKFKWTSNWIYLKVKSAPSFWSHLMEDMATAPLFGKLGNERNAMILFFALIGAAVIIILLVIALLVKCLKK